jgi:hypothetical protein
MSPDECIAYGTKRYRWAARRLLRFARRSAGGETEADSAAQAN